MMPGKMSIKQCYYNGRYVNPFSRSQGPDSHFRSGTDDYRSYRYDARIASRSSNHVRHDTRRDPRRSARLPRPRPVRGPYSTGRGPRRTPLSDLSDTNPYKLVNERPMPNPQVQQNVPSSSPRTTPATTASSPTVKYPSDDENIAKRITQTEKENPVSMSLSDMLRVATQYVKLFEAGLVTPSAENKVEVKPREIVTRERETPHLVDLLKPETLREKQPGILSQLYGGKQCSGCSRRFAPEQSAEYSQHLDWHFSQNRRNKDTTRRELSRGWYCSRRDWAQCADAESVVEKGSNWFEASTSRPVAPEKIPSVPAGSPSDRCALCGDKFDQCYHEEDDEWHLRNAVRFQDFVFHPQCSEEYKASLTKEEATTGLLEG